MPQPNRRFSKSRTALRRSSKKTKIGSLSICSHCSALKPPHVVCPACGYHKGILIKAPKTKKQEKGKK